MGMGMLLKGRKGKAHASSQYALEHLEEIHEQWASVGDVDDAQLALESLSLLEDEVALVHDALKQADLLLAFRTLEAIDLFLEEEDGMTWTGVEDSNIRTRFIHLLFSAWVTVVHQLPKDNRPENFKHVLKRAATTGEELSSMCEQGVTIDKALEFLQALASAPDEDEAGEEEEQEQAQESKGGAAASKAADLGGHDFFAAYQAYTQQLQAKVPGEQEEDETGPGGEESLQGTGDDESEEEGEEDEEEEVEEDEEDEIEAAFENQAMEAAMLRDLLKERQPSGRLRALDSPKMRPILLRVASRLPPEDDIRREVESAVGGPPESPAWQQALERGSGPPRVLGLAGPSASSRQPSALPTASMPAPHPSVVAAAHAAHAALDSPTKAVMHRALQLPGGGSGGGGRGGDSPGVRLGGFGSVISVFPHPEHAQQQQQQQRQQQQQQQQPEEVGLQDSHGLLGPQPCPIPRSLSMGGSMLSLGPEYQEGMLGGPGEDGLDDLLGEGGLGNSYFGGAEDDQPANKVARLI